MVIILALMHLPFLSADPDTEVSVSSRGAWTDEGLNSVQVRNLIHHGYLSMDECDNLIKTPLFGFLLVPFHVVFGPSILVGRAVVLLSVLLVVGLILSDRETRVFGTALTILSLWQFHLFQYTHYSLAEMMAISVTLLGIVFYRWSYTREKWPLWLVASTLCFSAAYFIKITFVYVVAVPFLMRFLQFLSERMRQRTQRPLLSDWSIQAVVTGVAAAFYYKRWYVPNREVFGMVKANQGSGRIDLSDAGNRFLFNFQEFLMVDGMVPLLVLLPVAMIGLLFVFRMAQQRQLLLFGLLAWLIVALHQLLLINPPTRYLLPLYFICGALLALALSEHYHRGNRWTAVLTLILLGGYNLSYYSDALQRRTFQLAEMRQYLDSHLQQSDVVLGVWGTTVADDTRARSIPVWHDFNFRSDMLQHCRPRAVITEHNEAESGQAFQKSGIDLLAAADSSRQFEAWRYRVNVFWLPPNNAKD